MVQKYQYDNYFDPTKLFVALAFTESGALKPRYYLKEIAQYVYRYYIANLEIARHNFNIVVRNIEKYGIEDICPFVVSTINQWIKEQKHNSLSLNDNFVSLNLEVYDESTAIMTKKMCETLFQKYYKIKLKPILCYSDTLELDDTDMESFGKSAIRQLVFEDIQYCPLTETTEKNDLCVVHILLKSEVESVDELLDKDNLLLLSSDVAEDYVRGLFYFDEFGRVINNGSNKVNRRMRLSINLITEGRRNYIKRHKDNIIKEV